MSIVNTETLEANKLVAKDGKEATEVSIPSLNNKLVFAMCNFDGTTQTIRKSINISSLVKTTAGTYTFKVIHDAGSNELIITGTVSGGYYYISPEDIGATTSQRFIVYSRRSSTEKLTDRDNCSVVVHYANKS